MKKVMYVLFSVLLLVGFSSCKKEETKNLQTGTGAKVFNWTVTNSDLSFYGTEGTSTANAYYRRFLDVSETPNVMTTGTILVYSKVGNGWKPLPISSWNAAGTLVNVTYYYDINSNGGVSVYIQFFLSNFGFVNLTADQYYKIVVIPGSYKKEFDVDLNDYEAVKKYFQIKD